MIFRDNLGKDEFNTFVNDKIGGSFTQNYAWAKFKENNGGIRSYLVGMEDDEGNLVAASMLLYAYKRKIKNVYAPSGPVLDYGNEKIVKTFFEYLTDFVKKLGAEVLEIEPAYVIREYNKKIEVTKEYDESIVKTLESIGFNHLGYVGQVAGYQLRYTSIIDLSKEQDELIGGFAKDKKKLLNRNEKYFKIKVEDAELDDLVYLEKFRRQLSEKKDFKLESNNYYRDCYLTFKEYEDARIIKAVINFKEIKKTITEELKVLKEELKTSKKPKDVENVINSLEQKLLEIADFSKKHENEDDIIVGIGLIVYVGKRATYIYEHTDKELGNFGIPTIMLNELITDSKERGCIEFDMLGLPNPNYKDNKNYSITEFKISFGGNIIEYVGVFVKPVKKISFFVKNFMKNISYNIRGIANERK
jgi:Uncharacterized protein involved in methicillin resistance